MMKLTNGSTLVQQLGHEYSLFLDAVRFAHLGAKAPVKSEAKNPSTFPVPDLSISHSAFGGVVL